MEQTKKLTIKGTNIWVEEVYTPRTMEERRKSVSFLKDARQRAERAILKNNRTKKYSDTKANSGYEVANGGPHVESVPKNHTNYQEKKLKANNSNDRRRPRNSKGKYLGKNKSAASKKKNETNNKTPKYMQIGRWNVRSLFELGTLKQLIHEMKKNKYDIIVLQETKMKDTEISEVKQFLVCNSRGQDRRRDRFYNT
ncbi:hypothetical protein ILUMI_00168 [Ignelater luminosus]|uniref:Endonuclease/exonuclease/phosphatase domain-containing protein n=1 Tax=Ignelater luminosus TaxID=2038154 RepID=A0A8K0DGZ1_IGNLU|nr:hypothetical protein ILUMI_00168 [Ignelater luminosus]